MEDRIKVVDSYPGSGKTSYAIQTINSYDDDVKVIYITPFLKEVDRILKDCARKNFIQPDRKLGGGSKLNHLIALISQGKNIVSTHALFSNITDELIDALKTHDYVLYLDEVFQTVEKYSIHSEVGKESDEFITRQDVGSLIAKGYIERDDDYAIRWIDNEHLLSKYIPLKRLADRGLLYFVDETLLLWSFPVEVFMEGVFSQIFILTYKFDCQLQAYYYNYFNVPYVKYHVENKNNKYEIYKTSDNKREKDWKKIISKKIHILDNPKLNRIGDSHRDARGKIIDTALSATWYDNNKELLPNIRENLSNYFKHIQKGSATKRLWTCFKGDVSKIKSKNVSSRSWLALNARATNQYLDRTILAYLINRYVDPFYIKFFQKKDIIINQDEYALSELIQWLWRSAIREMEDVYIYIPSHRMRTLLEEFLNE